jgi:peptide methionine sulfoxide reductase MsrB
MGIGNTIGQYRKASEAIKQRKYTSYACICVYMNIAKALPRAVILEYQDEDWSQTLDYEHISFRCRKCHEHGHLFRDCPLNQPVPKATLNL